MQTGDTEDTRIPIRWYFLPDGTPFGPYTVLASGNWSDRDNTGDPWTGSGEVEDAPRPWVDGSPPMWVAKPGPALVPADVHVGEIPPPCAHIPLGWPHWSVSAEVETAASIQGRYDPLTQRSALHEAEGASDVLIPYARIISEIGEQENVSTRFFCVCPPSVGEMGEREGVDSFQGTGSYTESIASEGEGVDSFQGTGSYTESIASEAESVASLWVLLATVGEVEDVDSIQATGSYTASLANEAEYVDSVFRGWPIEVAEVLEGERAESDQGGYPVQDTLCAEVEQVFSQQSSAGNCYGTGADGDVTISGFTTLTRSWNYANLTVTASGTLDTDGYEIHVYGTLLNQGLIEDNGRPGSSAPGTGAGGTGGAARNSHDLGGGTPGGLGGTGGPGTGGDGAQGVNQTLPSGGGTGGTGGTGGHSSGVSAGGSGGMGGSRTDPVDVSATTCEILMGPPQIQGGTGGGGGGGGGGIGVVLGGAGGGGGGGAGVICICARRFDNQGTISAIGGHGGNGGDGGVGGGGGGGGGAGGGGGIVFVEYELLLNLGTILVSNGTGGAGGAGR